jgi:hypothetical protein
MSEAPESQLPMKPARYRAYVKPEFSHTLLPRAVLYLEILLAVALLPPRKQLTTPP